METVTTIAAVRARVRAWHHAGLAGTFGIYTGMYSSKILAGVNPMAKFDQFFTDAAAGTLPSFVLIDPDFETNDDHPSHDVSLGQAMIASVYNALAQSPQWSRCLFVLTYDEHGGFFDHVAPPTCNDADPDYQRLGFRVPAIVAGPTVRRGAVNSTLFEHSSVAATLGTRYGMPELSPRMAMANDLSSCIDPTALSAPCQPPANPPVITVERPEVIAARPTVHGQPELEAMGRSGQIPAAYGDQRSRYERVGSWLAKAEELGAIQYR